MNTSNTEKDWLHRIMGNDNKDIHRKHYVQNKTVKSNPEQEVKKSGNGFKDVAGMDDLKKLVREGFINVLKNKECASAYGIKPPAILFYGPAGCGKTFFAEKMAEEVGIDFIKIVPDDLASSWLHGTQQKIGEVFSKAEKKAPVLLFFDEFDAMVPHRSTDESNQLVNGEVNEFLCMLNNASDRGIYVLAATNHPEYIDKAVLRTGRIDEMIYIDMPDSEARKGLFKISLAKLPVADDIDYDRLASLTTGFNCSDIDYIVKKASRKAFNISIMNTYMPYTKITQDVLEEIISHRLPSVSSKDLRDYERIRSEYSPKDGNNRPIRIGFK